LHLNVITRDIFQERSLYRTWVYRVHSVASGTQLGRPTAGEALERRLGGAVDGQVLEGVPSTNGADVDYAGWRAKMRQYGLSHKERAADI
jgi:hypothetical protein